MRKLHSVKNLVEGKGISLFLAAFGSIFLLLDLCSRGLFQPGQKTISMDGIGYDPAFLFGLMMVWGGLAQAFVHARFGKPQATMSPEVIAPGKDFEFFYQRPVQRKTEVEEISVFLVLRERVRYHDVDEMTTKDVDRLFQKNVQIGRTYQRQEAIEVRQVFRLPAGDFPLRNPYMGRRDASAEQMWVVKVRIRLDKAEEVWEEYRLELSEYASITVGMPSPGPELFDFVLKGVGAMKIFSVTQAMQNLLPHLRAGQVGDLYSARPSLLLERISLEEAQQAKELLEAAGAEIEVRPATLMIH